MTFLQRLPPSTSTLRRSLVTVEHHSSLHMKSCAGHSRAPPPLHMRGARVTVEHRLPSTWRGGRVTVEHCLPPVDGKSQSSSASPLVDEKHKS